jgi:hypothetical protein
VHPTLISGGFEGAILHWDLLPNSKGQHDGKASPLVSWEACKAVLVLARTAADSVMPGLGGVEDRERERARVHGPDMTMAVQIPYTRPAQRSANQEESELSFPNVERASRFLRQMTVAYSSALKRETQRNTILRDASEVDDDRCQVSSESVRGVLWSPCR